MTDKTTAPKRIYLDIGDQDILDRVRSGELPWGSLREVTWSEDNASGFGVAYVREEAAIHRGAEKITDLIAQIRAAKTMARRDFLFDQIIGVWEESIRCTRSGAREGAGA